MSGIPRALWLIRDLDGVQRVTVVSRVDGSTLLHHGQQPVREYGERLIRELGAVVRSREYHDEKWEF